MFAKLFGKDEDQVLVKKSANQLGSPEIVIFFEVAGVMICYLTFEYENTEKGVEERDKVFESITEEQARNAISGFKQECEGVVSDGTTG